MSNDDIVQIQDVAAVRAVVLLARRKVLAVSVVTTLLAMILAFLLAYHLSTLGPALSALFAGIFAALGAFVFVRWVRHYRSILGQLDALDQRVSRGETIYGSQVAFHSYR